MHSRGRQLCAATLVLGGCLFSGAARADTAADPREAEAKTACLAGRVDRGIELLAQLYTDSRDPNHIFNQGRCFEQNNRSEEALSRFREYLRKAKDLAPEERQEVDQHIRDCEARVVERPRVKEEPAIAVTAVQPAAAPSEGDARRVKLLRTGSYIAGGVGVAAVAFGMAMSLRTRSLSSSFEQEHGGAGQPFDRQAFASGQRTAVLQWVGYGVGAAALGTAVALQYLSRRQRPDTRVALVPALSMRGAGAAVRCRF
jgi:hypothetical protein